MRTERAPHDDDLRHGDTTPMIDVVFLLIIFFLCLDFRTLEAKLPAYLPKDRGVSSEPLVPEESLDVRIVVDERGTEIPRRGGASYRLEGHRVHWEVGPHRFEELVGLGHALARIAANPSTFVVDRSTGTMVPPPVTVLPGRSATYSDVAIVVDAVRAAGFERVQFGR